MAATPIQQIFTTVQQSYEEGVFWLYSGLLGYFPRVANYSRFDRFLLLNIVIIIGYLVWTVAIRMTPRKLYNRFIRLVFRLPFVRREVSAKMEEMKKEITGYFPGEYRPCIFEIPYKTPEIEFGDSCDRKVLDGMHSGSRYPNKAHGDFVAELAKLFAYSNPLHFDLHPMVKQMENQVIQMVSKMLQFRNQDGKACGTFNSGGTQSIIMALLAYREYKMKYDGVRKPNLVICTTGHVAAHKGADYFNIEIRQVKVDKNYEMDIGHMKKCIDSETICVYTSLPNFPYGTSDPIEQIARICRARGIPVHLDMCLGGFIVPFLKNQKGKPFFVVPRGVTSISVDPHKYGLSAKGASVLLYSSEKYRKEQYFGTTYWPGGLYGTYGIAGSRSGVNIASAWISMMKMGVNGYTENAKLVQQATVTMAEQLRKLDFIVCGRPNICAIGFRHRVYSVNTIQSFMKKRGWGLSLTQKPLCLHFSFTPLNASRLSKMIKDFQDCVKQVSKLPLAKESGEIELYGACAKIPDGLTKVKLVECLMDCFVDIV